jgi:hypothetical protein
MFTQLTEKKFHFILNEQIEILGYSVNTCCEYRDSG